MGAPFDRESRVMFLAPMQDITDSKFMEIVASRGAPDFFAAEYFRIHEYYEFEPRILNAVLSRPSGRTVVAQFIGENVKHIRRAIAELKKIEGVDMLDLNLGCPAPKIYRKNVGGGLLRDPEKITEILHAMRGDWDKCLSVKMRLGFADENEFKGLFERVVAELPDYVTIHARTVKQLYRGKPNYAPIKWAVNNCNIPIVANGDVDCARAALEVLRFTGCAGVMSGRGAVRNPWIFRQIKEAYAIVRRDFGNDFSALSDTKISEICKNIYVPTLAEVREYVGELLSAMLSQGVPTTHADSCMKKYLNFIGAAVDSEGAFLKEMRQARGLNALMAICDSYMLRNGSELFPQEPYRNLCPRPNHES